MATFRFTKFAIKDLKEIWNYTYDNWSEKKADAYYLSIIQSCNKIAKNPLRGKPYLTVQEGLHAKKISKHIIFYRVLDNENVEITRIFHERMDIINRL